MKTNNMRKNMTKNRHLVSSPLMKSDAERSEQRKKDKEFIHEMNRFIAIAGLLSDDPFFGGI